MRENMKKELTISDTKMLQGLAVFMMVVLHLFDRYNYKDLYQPLCYLKGYPVVFYFAQLSDCCVMVFAFCSGYALYKQYKKVSVVEYYRGRLKSLFVLMINYWLILFLFTGISLIMGKGKEMPGSVVEFIGNFLTINTTYNGAWWYLFIYIILVAMSPLIFVSCNKMPIGVNGFLLISIYISAYYVRFHHESANWFLTKYGLWGMTVFEFCMGIYFYKLNCLDIIDKVKKKIPKGGAIVICILVCAGMLIGHTLIIPSLFIAPLTGLIIIILFTSWNKPHIVESIFLILGKHSTNIWLIHMFFFLYIFKNLVFIGKYPVIILCIMLGICMVFSWMINKVLHPINTYIKKKF